MPRPQQLEAIRASLAPKTCCRVGWLRSYRSLSTAKLRMIARLSYQEARNLFPLGRTSWLKVRLMFPDIAPPLTAWPHRGHCRLTPDELLEVAKLPLVEARKHHICNARWYALRKQLGLPTALKRPRAPRIAPPGRPRPTAATNRRQPAREPFRPRHPKTPDVLAFLRICRTDICEL